MEDKMKEMMLKIIEDKKRKSASQSGLQRSGYEQTGSTRKGIKKHKKGGLFDK